MLADWQKQAIEKYRTLADVPEEERKYGCRRCFIHFGAGDRGPGGECPECGSAADVFQLCPVDHCRCPHDIIGTIAYCPVCGEAMCPECGSHDIIQISRVTGYLSTVGGFNAGKRQELKDRKRYTIS